MSKLACEGFFVTSSEVLSSSKYSYMFLVDFLTFTSFIYIIPCDSSFFQSHVACILNSQKDVNEKLEIFMINWT